MRRILFVAIIMLGLTSCSKEEPKDFGFVGNTYCGIHDLSGACCYIYQYYFADESKAVKTVFSYNTEHKESLEVSSKTYDYSYLSTSKVIIIKKAKGGSDVYAEYIDENTLIIDGRKYRTNFNIEESLKAL